MPSKPAISITVTVGTLSGPLRSVVMTGGRVDDPAGTRVTHDMLLWALPARYERCRSRWTVSKVRILTRKWTRPYTSIRASDSIM